MGENTKTQKKSWFKGLKTEFRMSLLILCHVVVTVLAFRTFQSNSCAHNFHLAFNIFTYVLLMVASHQFLGIKKKPTSIRPNIVSWEQTEVKPLS